MFGFRRRHRRSAPRPKKSAFREWAEVILGAVALFLFFRFFFFQAYQIPSESMEDTLLVGDYLFVNKLLYGPQVPLTGLHLPGFRDPRRGDIVVFSYPDEPRTTYIKRVIGVAGDTVRLEGRRLLVNGAEIPEPYTKHIVPRLRPADYQEPGITPPGSGNLDFYGPVTVPAGHVFLLGDNRENSEDSRFRGFIPARQIKGKATVIYFSLDRERRWLRFSRIGDLIR